MSSAQPDEQEPGRETPKVAGQISPAPASAATPGTPVIGETPPVSQLTPEEQMALYEKELKETDWGHQPC